MAEKMTQEARRHMREELLKQHNELAQRARMLVEDARAAGDQETAWLMRTIIPMPNQQQSQ